MSNDTQWGLWEVFAQYKTGKPHVHLGNVHAADAEQAIQNARDVYGRRENPISLWVVPSNNIIATTPEEAGVLFDSQNEKIYRHPQFYKIAKNVNLDIH